MDTVLLQGFHPLKHALRFTAEIDWAHTADKAALLEKTRRYAPDLTERMRAVVSELPHDRYEKLHPQSGAYDVLACAKRPQHDPSALPAADRDAAPAVFLERPTHLANIGACIRTAAAAGAGAVLTSGEVDVWHPSALRGSQGLHFALPVVHVDELPSTLSGRPLVVLDPAGEPFAPKKVPPGALLAFGSELQGASDKLKARADQCLALPMREGVSSLNLAASVAAVLYAVKYRR